MKRLVSLLALSALTACATTAVDMSEPRRVVGTENGIRMDAEIRGETLSPVTNLPIVYEITNERSEPVAIADIVPVTEYDEETQTVTLTIGSEVPGAELLPRLIVIAPGEKKQFSTTARARIAMPPAGEGVPTMRFPNALRLRLNFLGDVAPFRELVGIEQKAVGDRQLADRLFPIWIESNETLFTNPLPMRWVRNVEPAGSAQRR